MHSIKNKNKLALCLLVVLSAFNFLSAQNINSDNGNGTYTNPVIPFDFPDVDVIRVGDTYYMLSTTMFVFPGVPLLKSKDLVNWEYCTNIIKRMDYSPCYNLDGCNRYAHGQWAGTLNYHEDKFYVMFNTLNEGAFLCTATDPEGEWEIKRLDRGFHDCGLFFDEDGKIYVAHGYNKIYITELDTNFKAVGEDKLVYTGDLRPGLEGSHVYKLNGYYYLYSTYGGADGFQVALRSKNIWGPYEQKIVLNETDRKNVNFGIHQGALVQTQTGEWWTMLFIDIGPLGRVPSLQPVKWVDNWPVAGIDGKAVTTYKKPNVGKTYPIQSLPVSDEFNTEKLGMQWAWNHNPDDEKWSLKVKKGFLRLKTVKTAPNFLSALNTLTQRSFIKYDQNSTTNAVTKVITDNMKDGDIAGLCVFQDPYAYIGVQQNGREKAIIMVNNGKVIATVPIKTSVVYLRTSVSNSTQKATFEYSFDNKKFIRFGEELTMKFSLKIFTGNKFCLFNYTTKAVGGYVDFDWFRVD
ncbi:beta-xylosidase [Flavobacterium sp. 270]|uniref:glycoside hydrolase family 43 protein n=1 Tax=Flavobacterium sp. 270 TaxID=2512114 RepID=UPI0010667D29|nr:glycoside hydrolase 43 family protein [Flavobacterium sp. 270]TDW51774.1 beta-xylosidase [Flavobacterium sp. 270]